MAAALKRALRRARTAWPRSRRVSRVVSHGATSRVNSSTGPPRPTFEAPSPSSSSSIGEASAGGQCSRKTCSTAAIRRAAMDCEREHSCPSLVIPRGTTPLAAAFRAAVSFELRVSSEALRPYGSAGAFAPKSKKPIPANSATSTPESPTLRSAARAAAAPSAACCCCLAAFSRAASSRFTVLEVLVLVEDRSVNSSGETPPTPPTPPPLGEKADTSTSGRCGCSSRARGLSADRGAARFLPPPLPLGLMGLRVRPSMDCAVLVDAAAVEVGLDWREPEEDRPPPLSSGLPWRLGGLGGAPSLPVEAKSARRDPSSRSRSAATLRSRITSVMAASRSASASRIRLPLSSAPSLARSWASSLRASAALATRTCFVRSFCKTSSFCRRELAGSTP
mmetsp:Transcript_67098/g.151711  ORF Transcript_67098/g.151711 Transcript_67098/m.151711 type:complete len:393 (-) Transcript_67098:595-1773(-)